MTPTRTPSIMTPASRVAGELRQQIRAGRFAVGDRLPNEREMTDQFGVSRGTIRQALAILERERLITRQQGRGTFVSDPAFGGPERTDTDLIAAMVYEREFYFGAILHAASSQSATRGYMLTTGSNYTADSEQHHVEAFIRHGIRGVVLAPKSHSREAYDQLVEAGVRVVLIDTQIADRDEDFVSVNNRCGTQLGAAHLLELGHRRLAYIGHNNPGDLPCRDERIGGFIDACRGHGLGADRQLVLDLDEKDYADPIRRLLTQPDRPTGFVTYNDAWAVRLIAVARDLGLRVPEDLSVVGFDDIAIGRDYDVPLTTIHPEFCEVGARAVNILIDKLEHEDDRPTLSLLVTPRLVVRQSTASTSEKRFV